MTHTVCVLLLYAFCSVRAKGVSRMKVKMPLLSELATGLVADKVVFSSWKGIPYIRSYAKPNNPRTRKQQKHRKLFRDASRAFKALSKEEKEQWNRKAGGMPLTGFNLFVKETMKLTKG